MSAYADWISVLSACCKPAVARSSMASSDASLRLNADAPVGSGTIEVGYPIRAIEEPAHRRLMIIFPYDVRGRVGLGESGVRLDPGKCSRTRAGPRT